MRKTTSLRLPEDLRDRLTVAAEQQGTTLTALVERYAREGLATDAHSGIMFKSGPSGRRAALAGGPDVWEIVDALRTTTGPERDRVATVADQLGIHPRQVTIALGYAADHPDEIEDRIAANLRALSQAEQMHQARHRLLDSA
ncbi:MAG: CopG family transcriptional regulator [Nitriliruptoraceae bacterium]